ncbi:MAG: hypothetical protein IJG45_01900 [Oscillospiraceae bacterium]|nr:hypothetical protein [Oscillospiraceae bacterium]
MKECTAEEKQTKYNYVFCNIAEDYIEPAFMPLNQLESVQVYRHAFSGSRLKQSLFFLHWSKKINRIIRLPLKKLWYPQFLGHGFPENKPCCYVFYSGKYISEDTGLYEYIKRQNPNNKCIILLGDSVEKKKWDISEIKKRSDAIVTYNPSEAEEYELRLFSGVSYGPITDITTPDSFAHDVYFLGYAKNRLQTIYQVYDALFHKGFRCHFLLCGIKREDQRNGEGLHYIKPISYRENILNIQKSKCILEIVQQGCDAATLRTEEAHIYRRKLLTNNRNLTKQAYYDPSHMAVFSNADEIDTAFLKAPIDYAAFDDSYDYSPMKLIRFFEQLLED